jgi:hypothetical protein
VSGGNSYVVSDIRGYEEKKLSQPNPLRLTVRKHLKTLLSTR